MKIAITGSRSWDDADTLAATLDSYRMTELLHGGAEGADQLADTWAKEKGMKVTELKPDYDAHGAAAPHVRNAELVKLADGVIAFWDGQSKGTAGTIAKARRAGKLLKIVSLATAKPAQLPLW